MNSISFDVLVAIFYYLDPLDIISFSKTCTAVHEAGSARSVWISAYQNACFRNGIFTATHRINDLSTPELKHIATSPSRMLKILQQGQEYGHENKQYSLRPVAKYSFSSLAVPPIARRRKPHSLYLVPGGRLLVAVSESYISVFDLERVQEQGLVLEDAETNSKVFHRGLLLSISPTSHEDKIQIVASKQLTYGPNGTGSAVISVWEYAPENRSLNEVASTTLPNTKHVDIAVSCLAGNILIYFDSRLNTVNVWDFVQNLHGVFATPSGTSRSASDIMYARGKIILLGRECAAIWDMPELQSSRPDTVPMEPTSPDTQIMFDLPVEVIPLRASLSLQGMDTHRWNQYVDHGLPITLDTISDKTGSLQIILADSYDQPVENATSYYSHTFCDSSESVFKRWHVKQRYCKDAIIRTWYSFLSDTFHLSLLPSIPGSAASRALDPSSIPETMPTRSLHPGCKNWQDYSFDPASGRLCVADQMGEIAIIDYLVDPTKMTGSGTKQWEDCSDWDAIIEDSDLDDSDADG